jgi:uncharacterized protein YceK
VHQLVQGKGQESLYAGTQEQWSDGKRVFDGCFPLGILWEIDLPLTAFTDTMLAPFAWIPTRHETPRKPKPDVMPESPDESNDR